VALLIIANGIMIGFQTHPNFEDWDGFLDKSRELGPSDWEFL
jgi:hypothetical protein